MPVQSAAHAQALIRTLADEYQPSQPYEIPEDFEGSLFSFWHRGWWERVINRMRHGHSQDAMRLEYMIQKVQSILVHFPGACAEGELTRSLSKLDANLRQVACERARPSEQAGLLARIRSLEDVIFATLKAQCPQDLVQIISRTPDHSTRMRMISQAVHQEMPSVVEIGVKQVQEAKMLCVEDDLFFISPEIAGELDNEGLSEFLRHLPAPGKHTRVLLRDCPKLTPDAVLLLLEWCPSLAFPDIHDAPHLGDTPVRLKDCTIYVNSHLLNRCPFFSDHISANIEVCLDTVSLCEWKAVSTYIQMGSLENLQISAVAWRALGAFPCAELMRSFGLQVTEDFLERCWDAPLDGRVLDEGISIALLAIEHEIHEIGEDIGVYLSYCLGRLLRFGKRASPTELSELEKRVVDQILCCLQAFYLSALSSEHALPEGHYKCFHRSLINKRLPLLHWIVRNSPHLSMLVVDPLLPQDALIEQMELLRENFPQLTTVRTDRGQILNTKDGSTCRTLILPARFKVDIPSGHD